MAPDVDAVFGNAADHDLVVITTPNQAHVPLALRAIDVGLPVVVDKPLAPSSVEGRRLADAASAAAVPAAVFHNKRWDGDFMTVRRLVENGDLGRVGRFESRLERWRPEAVPDAWREQEGDGIAGGTLWDLGPHLIDQALMLFGRALRVYAELDRRRLGVQVDDDAFVALLHEGGTRSHLWMSQLAGGEAPRMRLLGTLAAYTKWGADVQEAALRAGESPREENWGREEPGSWGSLEAGRDVWPVETEPGAWHRFYEQMRDCVRGEGPVPVTLDDGIVVLDVIEAAQRSAQSGQVVELGP